MCLCKVLNTGNIPKHIHSHLTELVSVVPLLDIAQLSHRVHSISIAPLGLELVILKTQPIPYTSPPVLLARMVVADTF